MKKIHQIVVLALLALVIFTSSTMARDYEFISIGSPVIFEGTSDFFSLYFRLFNGLGNIQSQGPAITDNFSFGSIGRVEGTYFVDANNLKKELLFIDPGSTQSFTTAPGLVTLVQFTGNGWLQKQIGTEGFSGLTGIYILFDAEYIYLNIRDNEPEPRPNLVLVSTSTNGNDIAITVQNTGRADLHGEALAIAGLSYRYKYWVPESVSVYARESLGSGFLAAGETFTFSFVLPDISEEIFTTFMSRRGLWDSFDYPNPAEDLIGITLSVGGQEVHTFIPLNYKASLSIESVSMEEGKVFLTVVNSGIFYVAGETIFNASLGSDTNYLNPNAWIDFSQILLGEMVLAPGDNYTFEFGFPEIPTWAVEGLENQEETDQRYIRIRLLIGNRFVFFTLPVTV